MKKIQSKIKALESLQDFLHYKSMGIFSNAQGQLTPQYVVKLCRILKLVRDIIDLLLTCMNEEDPIKNEGAKKLIVRFFRHSWAANSLVSGGNPPKFELIQAFMVVLVTCKNEEDPIINKGSRVLTRFSLS